MRDKINSRGLERKDLAGDNKELEEFFKYRDELLAILPINSEERAAEYRIILKKYLKIDVDKLTKL